jgi:hypothetical protein
MDVLLFGGANSSGYLFNDTWQFNSVTGVWSNVTSSLNGGLGCAKSPCPTPRHDATTTWDSQDGVVILFGGCVIDSPGWTQSVPGCSTSASYLSSQTWTYSDTAGGAGSWTLQSPTTSPSARFAEGLADDPNDGYVLLFGGCGTTCPLGDTWTYTLGGGWAQITPTPHPSSRYGMAMSWVGSANDAVALFGGCTTSLPGCDAGLGAVNDTWTYSTGAWSEQIASASCSPIVLCPSPRYYMGQTEYQGPGLPVSLLIYGGAGTGDVVLGNATEAHGGWWQFSGTTFTWSEWTSFPACCAMYPYVGLGSSPLYPVAPRYDPMMMWTGTLYDGAMLFGGSSTSGSSLGDTWYVCSPPACSAPTGLLWPPPVPSAQYAGSIVYDGIAGDHYDVLFGGCGPHCGNGTTWEYTANAPMPWKTGPTLTASNSPPARTGASMVYFYAQGVVVLFGGMTSGGTLLNDLWKFTANSWTKLSPTGGPPAARYSAVLAYGNVSGAGYAVLFGGCGSTCPLSDTWVLTYSAGWRWTQCTACTGTGAPSARYGSAATYDVNDKEVVLFGGCGSTCPLGDTWTFVNSPAAWTKCTSATCTSGGPSSRWGAAMADNASSITSNGVRVPGYVVMFGGCGSTCPVDDTWKFSGTTWSKFTPTNSPPAMYEASMANDSLGRYLLLFGGAGGNGQIYGGLGWAFESMCFRFSRTSPLGTSLG